MSTGNGLYNAQVSVGVGIHVGQPEVTALRARDKAETLADASAHKFYRAATADSLLPKEGLECVTLQEEQRNVGLSPRQIGAGWMRGPEDGKFYINHFWNDLSRTSGGRLTFSGWPSGIPPP